MYKRKQYIIDKKFQLRTTFSIIGIVSIITAFIVGAIATSVVYNNEKIDNIHAIENNIFDFLTSPEINADGPVYHQAIKQIIQNHTTNMTTLRSIILFNKILLISLIFIIISEGITLYILLIRKTHRISGPIFVMTNYMKQLLSGQYPDTRPLRIKDELQDFYALFLQVIEKMKEKDRESGAGGKKNK